MKQLTIRAPESLIKRARNLEPAVEKNRPELALKGGVSQSDVLRLALLYGVQQLENEFDVEPKQTTLDDFADDGEE